MTKVISENRYDSLLRTLTASMSFSLYHSGSSIGLPDSKFSTSKDRITQIIVKKGDKTRNMKTGIKI